jgi:hypothetical protein
MEHAAAEHPLAGPATRDRTRREPGGAEVAAPPLQIDLGTAVRVSLFGGWAERGLKEEGVVIEVVPPGCCPTSERVIPARWARSSVASYVVQCWACRVLRREFELRVESL